jgi:hypothetical protein
MAHKHDPVICPNCGCHATENYCARCGQETHMHEDSFWSLIMHFIGHYFHYDSKFWQTMKALWFSPGKLTIAYRKQQRMRYIAPISLYIFISAVFFLTYTLLPGSKFINIESSTSVSDPANSTNNKDTAGLSKNKGTTHFKIFNNLNKPDAKSAAHGKEESLDKTKREEIYERVIHNMPKVFFFMIPLMAFILQLLFIKRKDVFYVQHIIYALHYHSFWFSVMLLGTIYPFAKGSGVVNFIILLLSAVYFIVGLKNVYNIGWLRSILYSIITALIYVAFAIGALLVLFVILIRNGY